MTIWFVIKNYKIRNLVLKCFKVWLYETIKQYYANLPSFPVIKQRILVIICDLDFVYYLPKYAYNVNS